MTDEIAVINCFTLNSIKMNNYSVPSEDSRIRKYLMLFFSIKELLSLDDRSFKEIVEQAEKELKSGE